MPRLTITILGVQPQPYRFGLDRTDIRLGRGEDNDILVDCSSVSATHAVIRRVKGGYELHDLGSTNGIKWKGEYVPMVALESGMTVSIGDASLDFELSADELSALALESSAKMLPPLRNQDTRDSAPVVTGIPDEPNAKKKASGCATVFWAILFIVLALVTFVVGVAVRFEREAGRQWLESIRNDLQPMEAPGDHKP